MKKLSLISAIILFVSSCATNHELIKFERDQVDSVDRIERVFDKNYEVNVPKTVFVGDPMIRVKDYYTSTSSGKRLEVIEDSNYPENVGKLFNICGKTEDKLLIVQIALVPKKFTCDIDPTRKDQYTYGILVDRSSMKAIQTWSKLSKYDSNTMQKNTGEISLYLWDMVFKELEDTSIDKSRGYDNFEIIYSGISNQNTLRTLYREYSSSDLARSDFFQELTYPLDKNVIRFKDIEIDLISVENDKVTFKVISDNRD